MIRLIFLVAIGILVLEAVSCSPVQARAQPMLLPTPQIHITLPPTAVLSPTPVSIGKVVKKSVPGSLGALARQAYGDRLIEWIRIPGLSIVAPVMPVGWKPSGETVEWDSPEAEVGWAVSSALPGGMGNVILYGHNNIDSSVFMRLGELKSGDRIVVRTGQKDWEYIVDQVTIIPVMSEQENKLAYDAVFQETDTAQLTLLSCWPPVSNTHRVIVRAVPAKDSRK
jgi:LPXTG-site transpeptidase (sortase) family protein